MDSLIQKHHSVNMTTKRKTNMDSGRHLRQLRGRPPNFHPLPRGQPDRKVLRWHCDFPSLEGKKLHLARAPPEIPVEMG